jgi:8-oxo-dGTP diphosphatase
MKLTTLCYIENKRGEYLMLHRTKKENDFNHEKWIGVGGKFEQDETPEECLLREVYEETGLTLTRWQFRGIVTFLSDEWEGEYMHLFTADRYEGSLHDCDEGELAWVPKSEVTNLKLWEGDHIFLNELLHSDRFFSLKLSYEGDTLSDAKIIRY